MPQRSTPNTTPLSTSLSTPFSIRPLALAVLALVLVALPAATALAQQEEPMKPMDPEMSGTAANATGAAAFQSTFCDGTYALCIKAPCSPIPTLNRIGNYYVNSALCECDVVQGWSMGPGACEDRAPMTQHGRTFLISTYSNLYNASNSTLSCDSETQEWAWCYGAPCVVDEHDPSKATCTCPIETGPSRTLGGGCAPGACSLIWSAANPAGDVYANQHYYDWMTKNQPGVPVNPPAAACPVVPPPAKHGDAGSMASGR